MSAKIITNNGNVKIFDNIFYKNGKANIGCDVILFCEEDQSIKDRVITDDYGYYEFNLATNTLIGGDYTIQFYGSYTIPKLQPDGDWERIQLTDESLLPITFLTNPTFQVSEVSGKSNVDVNGNEITYAQLSFTDLQEQSGILKTILVYSKHTDDSYDSDYKVITQIDIPPFNSNWSWDKLQGIGGISNGIGTFNIIDSGNKNNWEKDQLIGFNLYIDSLHEYEIINNDATIVSPYTTMLYVKNLDGKNINLTGTTISGTSYCSLTNYSGAMDFVVPLVLYKKPCYYDFYSVYLNSDRIPAKVNGVNIITYALNVLFDGIPDFSQLIGVLNLDIGNLVYNNAYGGDDINGIGFSSPKSMPSFFVELFWDDIKTYTRDYWNTLGYNNPVISNAVFTGTGLNDAISSGSFIGQDIFVNTFIIIIDSVGATDTFKWKKGSGSFTTNVSITKSAQLLSDGVYITFNSNTGHTLNDQWIITINPLFHDANGNSKDVSYDQSQKILDYVVYQFISELGNPPLHIRPGLNAGEIESNGIWYYMGNFSNGYAKLRCNPGDIVSFWVGFRTILGSNPVSSSTIVNTLPVY